MAEFDAWADYYDLIHTGLPGEAEFYVEQAVRIGGMTLELGCGTGRVAIPTAMSGVDVVGIDNSASMLHVCREKMAAVGPLKGNLEILLADMRDFAFGRAFDLITIPYRSFMHLLTVDEQIRCLSAVRGHLSADGVFMFNVWAARPSAVVPHLGPTAGNLRFAGRYPLDETDMVLVHYCSSVFNEHRQELRENHLVHLVDAEGTVHRTQALSLLRTWTTMREMEHLLRRCGFETQALFGDFDCSPFTARSQEMIWVLRRS